jgi:protein-disulfide isomerase
VLSRSRMHVAAVRASFFLILALTGCSAQSPSASAAGSTPGPELARRIETHLRTKYTSIPSTVSFRYGTRKPSEFEGFDLLPVTLYQGERESTLEFYISKDDKVLGRAEKMDVSQLLFSDDKKTAIKLDKMDISKLPDAHIDVSGRPVRGNPNAKVSMVVYDDFQCPFCAMMHDTLTNSVLPAYKDKVKIVYKDYPLVAIHPWATHASVNANCIAAQNGDAYWTYTDRVHAVMNDINKNDKGEKRPLIEQTSRLDAIAMEVGQKHLLDAAKLNACIKKQDASAVKASIAEADKLGVDSTPTLFINGERMAGAAPLDDVRAVLDRALVAAGETPPPPIVAEQIKPSSGDSSPKADQPTRKSNENK